MNFEAGHSYYMIPSLTEGESSPSFIATSFKQLKRDWYTKDSDRWRMGLSSLTNWFWGDVLAGDGNKGSNELDQPELESMKNWSFSADNATPNHFWDNYKEVIKSANILLMATDGTVGHEYERAYAWFTRAYFGFEALKIFGAAVPYPTE